MSGAIHFACPNCGEPLTVVLPVRHPSFDCPKCDLPVRIPQVDEPRPDQAASRFHDRGPAEPIIESVSPRVTDAGPAAGLDHRNLKIHRGSGGEFCVVLALVLPLIAQCILFFGNTGSTALELGLMIGTVVITAILLAVDAAAMGKIDLEGRPREGAVAVLVGVLLLWIVFYPASFFRRRHFGRPNLGVLALVVVVIFVGGPVVGKLMDLGILPGGAPPTCTSPDVIRLLDETLRKSPAGPSIKSIHGHKEVQYDRANGLRKGQCLVETESGSTQVTFQVKWLDPQKHLMQVLVEPFFTPDPPACTSGDIVAMVNDMIKSNAQHLKVDRVDGHKETRYDREAKVRYGVCTLHSAGQEVPVRYRVQWADQRKGSFHVQIEP